MKKVLLCLLLTGHVLALAAQTSQADSASVENALLDAVMYLQEGQADEAYVILDSLKNISPSNDAIHYYLGLCRYSKGDFNSAVQHIKTASQLDPSNNWYLETLANLYIYTGEPAEAGGLYHTLSERNPDKFRNSYTLALMADSYRLKRDYKGFFDTLTELVGDENIDDEQKYQALIGALGGFDKRTFNSILPQMDTLMQRFTEAEPKSANAHRLRMEIAASLGDDDTVIQECQTLMELQKDDKEQQLTCLSILGDTYHSLGQTRKAYKYYEQALKIDPEYCPVLNNYAYYLSEQRRRLCKATRMSRITVQKEPDNATYLDTYGWILFLRGKAKEAKPYFKHAMIYGGKESAVIMMHYAAVLEKLGEKDLAAYYRNLSENKKK